MTPEEYLALIQPQLTADERSVSDDTKALLLLMLWRLRQSLLASLPDEGLSRTLILTSLLAPFELELRTYSDAFLRILLTRLEEVDARHPRIAADYAGLRLTRWDYKPRRGEDLLRTTRAGGQTLYALFTPNAQTGKVPFVEAHLRAIKSKLQAGIMRGDPSRELARSVVAERTRRGFIQPVNARGTLYSALRNRDTALIAAAVWDVATTVERAIFTRQQRRTATSETPFAPNGWIWKATLDPKTCPVCRPLHNTRSDRYTGFPYVPPVHPRCRCRILPAQ